MPKKTILLTVVFCFVVFFPPKAVFAENGEGSNSESHENEKTAAVSPKKPWGEFAIVEEKRGHPWYSDVLLWIPNRFLDLVDVFKVDVGAGPAYGAVVRLTKAGQFGYRDMAPVSLRIGDFGRDWPVVLERSSEFGVGPGYIASKDRKVCAGEIGAGADLLIIGGYGGVCVEELVDFVAGIFFIDLMDDDL